MGCGSEQNATSVLETTPTPPATSQSSTFDLSKYAFPESIDPAKHYLFYLHGRIIEDQGIPAVSPDYGEYEYQAILERLNAEGFVVISEQRAKDTDSLQYAERVTEQIKTLLQAGVPGKNVSVVGASKGGGIAIFVSHLLENKEVNFVILAICAPATVTYLEQKDISLYGNVLSIYDAADTEAGSCADLFSFSEGKGLAKHAEIVLHVGTGHGILFHPLDEWMSPTIQWAEK